jgi:hypothetical protein
MKGIRQTEKRRETSKGGETSKGIREKMNIDLNGLANSIRI